MLAMQFGEMILEKNVYITREIGPQRIMYKGKKSRTYSMI